MRVEEMFVDWSWDERCEWQTSEKRVQTELAEVRFNRI